MKEVVPFVVREVVLFDREVVPICCQGGDSVCCHGGGSCVTREVVPVCCHGCGSCLLRGRWFHLL